MIKCKYCNYEWFPRTKETVKCPRCQKKIKKPGDLLPGVESVEDEARKHVKYKP